MLIPFLFFSHTAPGFLLLGQTLLVDHTLVSVPHLFKSRRRLRLIRAHLLSQTRERAGYGSHKWDVSGRAYGGRDLLDVVTV